MRPESLIQYRVAMLAVEDILRGDLDEAAAVAAAAVPDVVAAFDVIVPMVSSECSIPVLRRYYALADATIRTLVDAPDADISAGTPRAAGTRLGVIGQMMQRDIPALVWLAPTPDGIGFVKVVVDRLRGHFGGIPNQCVRARDDIDEHHFDWVRKALAGVELERTYSAPLQRAMAIFDLSSGDVADAMGVTRQAVEKWLLGGPPSDRLEKIGVLAEIADILHYRLRPGTPPIVARMKSDAYGDRSMLQMLADDEHAWLLASVRQSFDFTDVA